MTSLDSILKSRDITLPTKVHLFKAIYFPSSQVWMWELNYKESWALKNWCFWTVVLEKTLESPLDCKEIQPVNPKGNQPWIFIGRLKLKLKHQYFGHLMRRADSFEKTWCWERFNAEGEGDNRGWDGWMASPTQWTCVWVNSRSWWWTGRLGRAVVHGVTTSQTQWGDGTELNCNIRDLSIFLFKINSRAR